MIMSEKALYLLATFDKETQAVFAGYEDLLLRSGFVGMQTKEIPYHFTLGSQSVAFEDQLLVALETCSDMACIDIHLSHIGLFGLNVLFIEPNMNFELLSLQRKFFPDCGYGIHPWTAHATLLIEEPEAILKALPILAREFKPFNARIESVDLYEFFPARFIKSCRLNAAI